MTGARSSIPIIAALAALAGCRPPAPAVPVPRPGISIAVYAPASGTGEHFAIVDDRRWVELGASGALVFDAIDPQATLASLVIEPLAGAPLAIGACTRMTLDHIAAEGDARALERVVEDATGESRIVDESGTPAVRSIDVVPRVRCVATGPVGRRLVRILYVTAGLGFRARHEIAMTSPDRATVTSRFAIPTPAWGGRAEVTLFDGVPGAKRPPREVARGTVALDHSTAILELPARGLPARLRRVYDGAVVDGIAPSEARWGMESQPDIWVWAELDGGLPAGEVFVRVALPGEPLREQHVAPPTRRDTATTVRMPLWIDPVLRGGRERTSDVSDLATTDRFVLAVANTGDAPSEVWIEEALRPLQQPAITTTWPRSEIKPELADGRVRVKLVVPPGAIERLGYSIEYTR